MLRHRALLNDVTKGAAGGGRWLWMHAEPGPLYAPGHVRAPLSTQYCPCPFNPGPVWLATIYVHALGLIGWRRVIWPFKNFEPRNGRGFAPKLPWAPAMR